MTTQPVTHVEDDARADAALRALFASAERPPLGDEAFVRHVMGRVHEASARRGERAVMALGVVLVGLAVTLAPQLGTAAGELGLAFVKNMPHLPELSAQATGMLLAMGLAVAGWIYSERG